MHALHHTYRCSNGGSLYPPAQPSHTPDYGHTWNKGQLPCMWGGATLYTHTAAPLVERLLASRLSVPNGASPAWHTCEPLLPATWRACSGKVLQHSQQGHTALAGCGTTPGRHLLWADSTLDPQYTGPWVHRATLCWRRPQAAQLQQCCTPCWAVCQNAVLIRAYMTRRTKSHADDGGYTLRLSLPLHHRPARHSSRSIRASEGHRVCLNCCMSLPAAICCW
jgi:hypothetical protein